MIFYEDSHSYWNEDLKYQGVTSLISKFKHYTDWNKVAENYLKKRTRRQVLEDLAKKWKITFGQAYNKWGGDEFTVEWIRGVWADKSRRALSGGDFFHNWKEVQDSNLVNHYYNPVVDGKKTLIDLENLESGTYLELGIYSHYYQVCGQSDKVILDGRKFKVRDYKTDAEKPTPKTEAFFDKSLGYKVVKKFRAPISHIPDSNFYKHALQFSIYAFMLEQYGYECEGLFIDYVHTEFRHPLNVRDELVIFEEPEFDRVRVFLELEEIEVPYLREEAKAILKYNRYEYK